jgi:hypothetical protein
MKKLRMLCEIHRKPGYDKMIKQQHEAPLFSLYEDNCQ